MDLNRIIHELTKERDLIARIIDSLESVEIEKKATQSRRGRKSMDAAARKDVSERMRRYWAKRRSEKGLAPGGSMASSVDRTPIGRSAVAGIGTAA